MEDNTALDFLTDFLDPYPKEFNDGFEAMECLSRGPGSETLLVREKLSGRLLIAKCYEKEHPLYSSTEPEELRALSHPGLPAFAGEYTGGAMRVILREYIPGKTLAELMTEGAFSPEETLDAGLMLCDILKYLHSRVPPVIHRDIKPQNIVVGEDGLWLIDLGISRLYEKDALSDTVYYGSRDFAPPEQYGFLQTDCRSDIYSLGVLLAWMLTGKAEPIKTKNTPLERVIASCTAFAPEDRVRSAAAAERALLAAQPEAQRKRWAVRGTLVLALVLLTAAGLLFGPGLAQQVTGVRFSEPLVEEAVRLMLGKGPGEKISEAELASVTELYITRDDVCADIKSFLRVHDEQNREAFSERGPMTSLQDLEQLPNLRILCIASEQIEDISPLASLTQLFQAELRFNNVSNLSPLAGLPELSFVGLNSNPVTDLSPLASCPALNYLDLCNANAYKGSDFSLLGDLGILDISNATDSFLYLGGKIIRELKLSRTSLTDLSCLRGVKGLEKLELCNTSLTDLSELRNHPELTALNLTDIPTQDYTVLLELPALETVTASEDARGFLDPVAAQGSFSVTYP